MFKKMNLKYTQNRIWIFPLKHILIAILLSAIVVVVDKRGEIVKHIPAVLLTTDDLARTILGVLVGALLSITTFTFSTTMVVLTMYSSQFSPRIVENFISDETTLNVLGIFLGGFFYSIISLFFAKTSYDGQLVVSASVGVVYSIICVIYFVIFIFKVSSSIQAYNLIERLYKESVTSISEALKLADNAVNISEFNTKKYSTCIDVPSNFSGYIQNINYSDMISYVNCSEAIILLKVTTGDFVVKGEMIANVYLKSEESPDDFITNFNNSIVFDSSRNSTYDYRFAIQKIVDIALRAISPGINDPNTAKDCINILGILLSKISHINGRYCLKNYVDRKTKLIYPLFNFDKVLIDTFYPIIHYGEKDFFVLKAIFKALENIKRNASPKNREDVNKLAEYIYQKASDFNGYDLDKTILDNAYLKLRHME